MYNTISHKIEYTHLDPKYLENWAILPWFWDVYHFSMSTEGFSVPNSGAKETGKGGFSHHLSEKAPKVRGMFDESATTGTTGMGMSYNCLKFTTLQSNANHS